MRTATSNVRLGGGVLSKVTKDSCFFNFFYLNLSCTFHIYFYIFYFILVSYFTSFYVFPVLILIAPLLLFLRYVPTAVCRPDGCSGGPYRCHQRHYRVRVLRQKTNGEDFAQTDPVPETLRNTWVADTVTVTVACECGQ